MDDKGSAVIVQKIDYFNHPAALPTSNHFKLLFADLTRVTATGKSRDCFDFRYCATMFGRMILVPFNPSELHGNII